MDDAERRKSQMKEHLRKAKEERMSTAELIETETGLIPSDVPEAVNMLQQAKEKIEALERRRDADFNNWLSGVTAQLDVAHQELIGVEGGFEQWCRINFGWSHSYVSRIRAAGKVQLELKSELKGVELPMGTSGPSLRLPSNERQYREIATRADQGRIGEVWRCVLEASDGKPITNSVIAKVLKPKSKPKPKPEVPEPVKPRVEYSIRLGAAVAEIADVAMEAIGDELSLGLAKCSHEALRRLLDATAKAMLIDIVSTRPFVAEDAHRTKEERDEDVIKDGFDRFWAVYKTLKGDDPAKSQKVFANCVKNDASNRFSGEPDPITAAIDWIVNQSRLAAAKFKRDGTEAKYIPKAAKWLADSRDTEFDSESTEPTDSNEPEQTKRDTLPPPRNRA